MKQSEQLLLLLGNTFELWIFDCFFFWLWGFGFLGPAATSCLERGGQGVTQPSSHYTVNGLNPQLRHIKDYYKRDPLPHCFILSNKGYFGGVEIPGRFLSGCDCSCPPHPEDGSNMITGFSTGMVFGSNATQTSIMRCNSRKRSRWFVDYSFVSLPVSVPSEFSLCLLFLLAATHHFIFFWKFEKKNWLRDGPDCRKNSNQQEPHHLFNPL